MMHKGLIACRCAATQLFAGTRCQQHAGGCSGMDTASCVSWLPRPFQQIGSVQTGTWAHNGKRTVTGSGL